MAAGACGGVDTAARPVVSWAVIPMKTHVSYRGGARSRRSADRIVAELIVQRFRDRTEPVVIAIGGPGGTGKSTFAADLAARLGNAAILTLDDYKTPRETRAGLNLFGAAPEANRMDLIADHLGCIRQGRGFDRPVYDMDRGAALETERFEPARFNLIDGEISTYPAFRELVDFAVFVDSDWKTQLQTRISRDIEQRGYSREKAIATLLQSNLREFAEHGAASKQWADVHLYRHHDGRLAVESVARELYERFASLLAEDLAAVDLDGLVVPVATPFDEAGAIDEPALIRHLEWLAEQGVSRVLINGTTGEFFSLSPAERRRALIVARRYFPGVVMYHAGADSAALAREQAKFGEDAGADAILLLPPYYLADAPPAGLAAFFTEVMADRQTPLILYNFPKHTGNPITAEVLAAVEHYGMKDSSADLSLVGHTPHYFVGGDRVLIDAYEAGACGFVSTAANAFPDLYVAMERALATGDRDAAEPLQRTIGRVIDLLEPNPFGITKQAIRHRLGDYPTHMRPPLSAVTAGEIEAIGREVDELCAGVA